jgi:large subunit ribosomal protein L15
MQIHNLKVDSKKTRKRIGRGGKRGTYSGRGIKGQKSRSGVSINPLFEGGRSSLVERLKKNKGFKSPHAKKKTFTFAQLDRIFSDGDTVSTDLLLQKGLIDKLEAKKGVKIIGGGKLKKKLKFSEEILMTESVKKIFLAKK